MKKLFLLLFLFLASFPSNAQNELIEKGCYGLKIGGSASIYQLRTYSITATPHYKVTSKLDAGLGLGFLYSYHLGERSGCSMPFYADVKYAFHNKRVTPFIEAQFGLNINLTSTESVSYTKFGLRYITIQTGVSVRHSDFSVGIMSYNYTQHNMMNYGWDTYYASGHSLFLRYAYNFKLTK